MWPDAEDRRSLNWTGLRTSAMGLTGPRAETRRRACATVDPVGLAADSPLHRETAFSPPTFQAAVNEGKKHSQGVAAAQRVALKKNGVGFRSEVLCRCRNVMVPRQLPELSE